MVSTIHNKYALTTEIWEEIPALINGSWTTISFNSKEEFANELESIYFKEVGEYGFDEDAMQVLSVRNVKIKTGYYDTNTKNSKPFLKFWDFEKEKCRKGVFIISGSKRWYFSRDIYFWWNFLPIWSKKLKREIFPDITDAHVRLDLYEFIAELKGKHAIIVKKRQFGSSYYHAAKLINRFWFEPNVILKIGASDKKYIAGKEGTWRYFNSYRDYLNDNTGWIRFIEGGDEGPWECKHKVTNEETNVSKWDGRKGFLIPVTFEKTATNGVGGAVTYFYHEEAGVAPKMDDTYGFMLSAIEDGDDVTGQFIGAGSVGELSDCEPLKKYIYSPEENGFYGVPNNMYSKNHEPVITGLFISEAHAYTNFIDEFGNSDVEGAIERLTLNKEQWEKNLDSKAYSLKCSQKPTWLDEAFKYRGDSEFPTLLIQGEELRLQKHGSYESVDLVYDETDPTGMTITALPSARIPITKFPINPKEPDKTGAVCIKEHPVMGLIPLSTYYATIDPVGQGKTLTSNSLVSIYIYRNVQMVARNINGIQESVEEGGEIVAWWCGRYDDIDDTHEELIKLILYYKAWALCENNVSLFIGEMQRRNLAKFLVPKSQFSFATELKPEQSAFIDYGWRNTGDIFDKILKSYLIKHIKSTVSKQIDDDGNLIAQKKGISTINDPMALVEMQAYRKGLNVDRLITLGALFTFVEMQSAHRRNKAQVIVQNENHNLDNAQDLSKLNSAPVKIFRSMEGNARSNSMFGKKKSILRNLR